MKIMLIIQLLLSSTYGSQSNLPVWPADFKWSSDGKPKHYDCIRIEESADPHTWHDNYFCWRNYKRNPGIKWSSAGKIRNMRCTQIIEALDPHTWNDNYLCERHDSPYKFKWYSWGKRRGRNCMKWEESADPHSWNDNWLCGNLPKSTLPSPVIPTDYKRSSNGLPSGHGSMPKFTRRNWMKYLDGSKKLSLYSIPGTHDSAARDQTILWVNCQELNIFSQLEIGVRFFDMRVAEKNGEWVMMHDTYDLGFKFQRDMLKPIYMFLNAQPSECVIMKIQKAGDGHLPNGLFAKYWGQNPAKWLLQDEVPTLHECRGKIFVLRRYWSAPSNMNIRSWGSEKVQDNWEIKDQWRRLGFLDDLGKGFKDVVDGVGDVAENLGNGLETAAIWTGAGAASGLGYVSDGINDLLDLDGKDSDLQKQAYIVSFHYKNIRHNFNNLKLHINHWSYFGFNRGGVPYLNRATAEKMRKLDIIPKLRGPNLGICVFDFPTRFQVEQVLCRNYGKTKGGCFK